VQLREHPRERPLVKRPLGLGQGGAARLGLPQPHKRVVLRGEVRLGVAGLGVAAVRVELLRQPTDPRLLGGRDLGEGEGVEAGAVAPAGVVAHAHPRPRREGPDGLRAGGEDAEVPGLVEGDRGRLGRGVGRKKCEPDRLADGVGRRGASRPAAR